MVGKDEQSIIKILKYDEIYMMLQFLNRMQNRRTLKQNSCFFSLQSRIISYLHPSLIEILQQPCLSFSPQQTSGNTNLNSQTKTKKESQVVSLKLTLLPNFFPTIDINHLSSSKKTIRTKELIKFLIPRPQHRNQIQLMRLQLLAQIKKNQSLSYGKLSLILQLYYLLNFEQKNIEMELKKYEDGKEAGQLKKILISLKKMIGNEVHLEEEEREEKRKAYSLNIGIRQILSYSLNKIQQEEVRQRLSQLLSMPKNKKWLGSRLYKFLLQNNWNKHQMSILAATLKQVIKENHPKIKKQLRNVKTTLSQVLRNMNKFINDNSTECSEENQNNIEKEEEICFVDQASSIHLFESSFQDMGIDFLEKFMS